MTCKIELSSPLAEYLGRVKGDGEKAIAFTTCETYRLKNTTQYLLMPMIEDIQTKIANEQYEFSKHAVDQSIIRQIRLHEIVEAIANGQIIEDYPNDKYAPSCLICGVTQTGRTIHIQTSYPSRPLVKIITVYEPDPNKWNDNFTVRRTNNE